MRKFINKIRYNWAMLKFLWNDTPFIFNPTIGQGKERMRNIELMLDRAEKRRPKREDYGL